MSRCRSLAAGGAALLLLACASAPEPWPAEPALFVARDADSEIYLFGTVHIRRQGEPWGGANARSALARAEEVWTEMDLAPGGVQSVQAIVAQRGLSRDRPLSSRLTGDERARLGALTERLGISAAMFEPMQPWLAALTLSIVPLTQAGYDPDAGVDRAVLAAAPETAVLRHFETAEQQIGFFADLSEAAQMQFLREAIDEAEAGVAQLETLSQAWRRGDLDTLEALVIDEFKAEAPEFYNVIFTQRNRVWSEQLVRELDGAGVDFVAVGAGHMLGEDGLVAMLRARGVSVERVR